MNRQEKELLVINHLPEVNRNVLAAASDEQLDRLVVTAQRTAAANVAELETQLAQTKLMLCNNGVLNSDQNWLILAAHFPTGYYDFDQARLLILNNAAVRNGLIWRAGVVPFADYNRQMTAQQATQQAAEAEERRQHEAVEQEKEAGYRLFVAAAKEATLRGVSVAPIRGNWSLILDVLYARSKPLTMDNILWAIFQGNLNFAQDDTDVVQAQTRQEIFRSIRHKLIGDPKSDQIRNLVNTMNIVELRERIDLAKVLGDGYSMAQAGKDERFRAWLVSVTTTNELRQKVAVLKENTRLRSLSPAQLRAESAAARQQQPQKHQYSKLPFNGPELMKMSVERLKDTIRFYGREAVDAELKRYQLALKETGYSRQAHEMIESGELDNV